jgi:WASH complex subunit strumpellin
VYDIIERSVQIKHYITETQKSLNHMIRIVNIKKQLIANISYITDFSYAWITIEEYLPLMQSEIRKEPQVVLNFKTMFMKLASIMNYPLLRIIECNSDYLKSVANYYSNELVRFVKEVL